ncbi:NAD-dependent succinate-semialdehyde dehydrogenase [Aquipuribacter nitratireducens]|uniref:NAD-dependent succinate-semialdehyde dehydrogenase n=1 Tax=Aquipuribacter nitratireducens TaxID=650104 RepID=A0ABW0GNL7_9MICO
MSTATVHDVITSEDEARALGLAADGLWIAGEVVAARSGATMPVDDPATGRPLADVADADEQDATTALDHAVEVADTWARTPPRERGEILRRAYELVTQRADDLALLMTLEMGKPLAEARGEVAYSAEFLRWFSEEAVRVAGRWSTSPDGATRLLTMKRPVGPTLMVTPWNFPLAMGARKIGPAVAAGCTMVVKPASQTPLSMYALARLLQEAGLPDGVLNVVTTRRSGAVVGSLLKDRRLRKLTFTGSTEVGRVLVEQSARNLLRVSMELGGNAPFLVMADADLDAAVDGAMVAKMRTMGEACTAANRFLVHASVAEDFASRLAHRMSRLRVGRGTDPGVQVGPLIDGRSRDDVDALVQDARDTGADVLTGGEPLPGAGSFYAPTVLSGVAPGTRLLEEEIFGPVAPVVPFDTVEDALETANGTDYGLVAYAYTRDLSLALRLSEELDTGMVGINQGLVSNPAAPFGGVKHSGFGREGGPEGIEEYLETRYVGIKP